MEIDTDISIPITNFGYGNKKVLYIYFKLNFLKAICVGSDSNGYLGCFADIIDKDIRDLNGLGNYNTNTRNAGSLESCVAYCNSLNFTYSGLQYG